LLAASIAIFLLVRVVPGDPARLLLKNPTPETMAAVRRRLGLDRPLAVQYFLFLKSVLVHGDFGESVVTGRDVRDDLARTWPATMELAVAAMLVATGAGLWLGIYSARHAGTWRDALGTMVSLAGLSVPVFWLALLAILLFSLKLGWFPAGDRMSVTGDASLLDQLRHLVLPALVLATIPMAFVARVTRGALLEAFDQDFIRTARAKGASERAVLYRHALRAALAPIVTMINTEFAYLLGGAVLTETVFAWPGIGRYIATAVLTRDYPAIQGSLLVLVALVMVMNVAADLAHYLLDPQLRR
jgi:ABC-type dipeptide/oligopeptide/nickel transport system permease component